MAADGRYVAFTSAASNFDTLSTGAPGTFVRDLKTSATFRVSVSSTGASANGTSLRPAISDDGRYIAFDSLGTNLVSPDTNGYADVFFRDRGPQLIGDLNGDKHVNATDQSILLQNTSISRPCCAADLDHDGDVDGDDEAILVANWTG
jgi:Tol biopolymer transport system component